METLSPFFCSLSLAQRGDALRDLLGGQVFDVGGAGPLVVVGVGDAGSATEVAPAAIAWA